MADSQISGESKARDENMSNIRRYGEIEEITDDLEKAFENFKNFEIVEDAPCDHNFLSKTVTNKLNGKGRTLIEKMKPEWESLKLCLTNTSIYVRTYEKRPDLMRAIVVGPKGTPDHHALFCFDIRFPSKYPNQPPDLFYRSYPPSSNPNSDTNQKLKSFFNLKNKTCSTPRTTLQLLLLIHNSLLINKANDEGEKGTKMTVMKQTWEAMLCMMKSLPQGFEAFVQGHFRTRAHKILMNYKIHVRLDVTTIGLFSRLIRAFEDNGTYCQHHRTRDYFDLLLLDLAPPPQQKTSNSGIGKKMSTVFQGMFL